MAQLVKRVTLSGSTDTINFTGYLGSKFLVKNFSDSDIYVSFESPIDQNASFKIASGMYQVLTNNEDMRYGGRQEFGTIYISGTGEVEIDVLSFRAV